MILVILTAVLSAALAIAAGIIFYCRVRIRILRRKLSIEMRRRAETGSFIKIFSQNIQKRADVGEWMTYLARYVADLVEARSLCLFFVEKEKDPGGREGEYLIAKGIFGPFPARNRPAAGHIMTNSKYILEDVLNDRIGFGDGLIGKVALTQHAVLITNPRDSRLVNLRSINPVTS